MQVLCTFADWATTSSPALLTKSYMGVIIEMLHNFEVPEQPISGIPKLALAMSPALSKVEGIVEWRVILPDYQQPSITN